MVDSDEPNGSGNDVSALLYWNLCRPSLPAAPSSRPLSPVYVENVTESPGYQLYDMTQDLDRGHGQRLRHGQRRHLEHLQWRNRLGTGRRRRRTGRHEWQHGARQLHVHRHRLLPGTLNAAGATMLEGWINTPANNKGFMIHAGSTTNGL